MTYQEAIHELEAQIDTLESMIAYCKDFEPKADVSGYGRKIECYKLAVSALSKQIPQEPKRDGWGDDCCPNCGWCVFKDEWGGRYLPHCENCGQAIDWGWDGVMGCEEDDAQ